VSNAYGYGPQQPGRQVLPPPQAAPWQQQPGQYGGQQPYGQQYGQQYGQYGQQPYGPRYGQPGGFGQFGGYPQPPRRRGNPLRILIFGLVGLVTLGVGVAVLLASIGGGDDPSRPTAGGPSVVPTARGDVEPGTAEDVLVNNPVFSVGALDELDCKAEDLGNGQLAEQKKYYEKLFGCLNEAWRPALDKIGVKDPDPGLVVFDKPVGSPCGRFTPRSGRTLAVYCSLNHVMYTDVLQMAKAFGPTQDLAFLMVIGHEYGHHIQNVSGLWSGRAAYLQEHPGEAQQLDSSRRFELQASCFAGVFSRAIEKSYPLTGRLDEFEKQAKSSFGDSPSTPEDERTHGLATSQGFWIMNGFNVKETKACNTYAAGEDIVR
jgi:predicted metalloprotease